MKLAAKITDRILGDRTLDWRTVEYWTGGQQNSGHDDSEILDKILGQDKKKYNIQMVQDQLITTLFFTQLAIKY
jgi:hypothetical protein